MQRLSLLSLLSVVLAAAGSQKHMSLSHRYGEAMNGVQPMNGQPQKEDGRMIMMIPMGESGEYQMIPIDMHQMRKLKERKERHRRCHHHKRRDDRMNHPDRDHRRRHHHSHPPSYRYGTKLMGAEKERPEFNQMMRGQEMPPTPMKVHHHKCPEKRHRKHKPYRPESYRYGQMEMHMEKKAAPKYKYVEGYGKNPNVNKRKELNMKGDEMNLRKMTKEKVYQPPSYRYGRKFTKMQEGKPAMSMQNASVQMKHKKCRALPKAKPMDTANMIVVELLEDAKGNLAKAETNIQMATRRLAPGLEETHIKMSSSEEGLFRMEGHLRILARPNAEAIMAGRKPVGRFNIGTAPMPSMKPEERKHPKEHNGYGSYKFKAASMPKVKLDRDLERLGMALLLGIAATLVMLALAKFLFSLWVGLDERKRREDENKLLLGEESSSTIHPISVAYKN